MSTGETLTLIVLSATLLAVLWYAWEARRQAKASFQMAQEMENSRQASVRPVLNIAADVPNRVSDALKDDKPTTPSYSGAILTNVGTGPALDVSCLFHRLDLNENQEMNLGIIEVGGIYPLGGRPGQLRVSNLLLAVVDGTKEAKIIFVRYGDIYGNEYESSREIVYDDDLKSFSPGKLTTRKIRDNSP